MTEKQSQGLMSKAKDGIDRRKFLLAGAVGAASVAGVGGGISPVVAQQSGAQGPWTNSTTGIRTAVITDAQLNIGPILARKMAALNYNLVIADVMEGLPDELRESAGLLSRFLVLRLLRGQGEGHRENEKRDRPGSLDRWHSSSHRISMDR